MAGRAPDLEDAVTIDDPIDTSASPPRRGYPRLRELLARPSVARLRPAEAAQLVQRWLPLISERTVQGWRSGRAAPTDLDQLRACALAFGWTAEDLQYVVVGPPEGGQ